jgi:DNA-binding transcriptional ArsR family regulator
MDADLLTRIRGEIETRLIELRPIVEEYESLVTEASSVRAPARPTARRGRTPAAARGRRAAGSRNGHGPSGGTRAPRGAAQQAIVAALEHGSHTVSELGVVTGMRGPSIRENLRRLLAAGSVARGKREGKAAYRLASHR